MDDEECALVHFVNLLLGTASGAVDESFEVAAGCRNGRMPDGEAWLLEGTRL